MLDYIKKSRDVALTEIIRLVNEGNENYIKEINVEQKQKTNRRENK